MARQLSIALGAASHIASVCYPTPDQVLDHAHDGWWFMAIAGFAAAIAGSRIGVVVQADHGHTSDAPEAAPSTRSSGAWSPSQSVSASASSSASPSAVGGPR